MSDSVQYTSLSECSCKGFCISCAKKTLGSCCCILAVVIVCLLWLWSGLFGARYIPIGPQSLPAGFVVDMISLLLQKEVPGYAEAWCGGAKNLATCTIKENFPGPGSTSYMRWDDVWEIGSKLPEKEWAGEWWRGNELGYIINVPVFWSGSGISPMSIVLGSTPKQHAAIRPIMETMWAIKPGSQQMVQKRVREFLRRESISLPGDTTALVHQILNEVGLHRDVSFENAQKFLALQTKVVALGTVGHLVPGFLSNLVMGSITAGQSEYVNEYMSLVEKLYGDKLKHEDCSPSVNCSVQLASATWDALYAAGGLSVPGTINTGLGLLFDSSENSPAQSNIQYNKDKALEFYWESIRFFPPVVGFPHWRTRPTCAGSTADETAKLNKSDGKTEPCKLGSNTWAGYPEVSQYEGGARHIPNLAIAMSDPRKWGSDSAKFKIRPLSDYNNYSVGFAEMAVDNKVAGGRMNRICPGKELALMIGKTFFEEFDKDLWTTSDSISWKVSTPFVGSFTLTAKRDKSSSAKVVHT